MPPGLQANANTQISGTSHLGIVKDEKVINEIARKAAEFYKRLVDSEVRANPAKKPWDTRTGKVTNNRIEGGAW